LLVVEHSGCPCGISRKFAGLHCPRQLHGGAQRNPDNGQIAAVECLFLMPQEMQKNRKKCEKKFKAADNNSRYKNCGNVEQGQV